MVLSFKTHLKGKPTDFVKKITEGTKIHTLREDVNQRWKAGITIQFATGLRSNKYNQFKQATCTGVQQVRINNHGILTIAVNGRQLRTKAQILEFVQNDGFETEQEFEEWFAPLIEKRFRENEMPLYLWLIHWTDKRY